VQAFLGVRLRPFALHNFLSPAPARPWIVHEYPRYINIPGVIIRKQLVGTHPIDPELCSAIIRRMNQIAKDEALKLNVEQTSCALEPDFAVS
jgi:hypothetical protein